MGAVASVSRPTSRASTSSRKRKESGHGTSLHKTASEARMAAESKSVGDLASIAGDDLEDDGDFDPPAPVSAPQRNYEPQSALELRVMKTLVAKNQARVQAGRGNKSCLNRVLLNFPRMQVTFAELHRLYDETDTDGSGSLEIDEIEILMAKLNPAISKAMVREIFVDADVSKDGSVQFKELICCIGLAYILDLIPELGPEAEHGGSKIFADTKGVRRVFELATDMFLALDQSGRGIVSFRDMAAAFSASADDSAMTKETKASTERRRNSLRRMSTDSGKLLGVLSKSDSSRRSLNAIVLPPDGEDASAAASGDGLRSLPLSPMSRGSAASLPGVMNRAPSEDALMPDVITAERPLEVKHSRPNLLHLMELERQGSDDALSAVHDDKVHVTEGASAGTSVSSSGGTGTTPATAAAGGGTDVDAQDGVPAAKAAPEPEPRRVRRASNAVPLSKPRPTQHMMSDLLSKERWKELDLDDSGEITYMEFLVTFVKWVSSLSGDDEDEDDE